MPLDKNDQSLTTAHVNPILHINGSSLKSLNDSYAAADKALHEFIQNWQRIEFNARDYYPQGPDAYPAARDERDEIDRHLRSVRDYLRRIREAIRQQDADIEATRRP